ncbi:MAG: hypothetical protein RI553_04375, partial [Salibaculum sp.]|nr:hypothetical protein [Salibaculum sp.]
MNMQTSDITAPPAPKSLEAMQLPLVMMRDIVLKTMFRKNVETVSDLARAICLPGTSIFDYFLGRAAVRLA